jgi:hypothetical protein
LQNSPRGGGNGIILHKGVLMNAGQIGGGNGGGSNQAYGAAGGNGVNLDGGTLIAEGTSSGGSGGLGAMGSGAAGDAVEFGTKAATLEVDPGAVFNGRLVGNAAVIPSGFEFD